MTRLPSVALTVFAAVAAAAAAPVPQPPADRLPPTPEQWRQSANNIMQIGLAVHNYESGCRAFPNNGVSAAGKPLLSWRVAILPYLGEQMLHAAFKPDEPWDSDHNKALLPKMPKVYAPIRVKAEPGETFYRGFDGPGAVFERGRKLTYAGMTDGLSNTALVVEAAEPVIWTKPDDLPFDPEKPLPKLGGLFGGEFNLLTCDGAVHRVRKDFDAATLKSVVQRNDGLVISFENLYPKK